MVICLYYDEKGGDILVKSRQSFSKYFPTYQKPGYVVGL
jgi:hypothetical protein